MQGLPQLDANGNCCCDPDCAPCAPAGLPTPTRSCVSKNGSASITGWSKLANFNSGDWNTRKYNRVSYSATSLYDATQRVWTNSTCSAGQADSAWRQLHLSDETPGLIEDFGGPSGKRVVRHIYSCVDGSHIIGTTFMAPLATDAAESSIESGRITNDTTDQVTASQSSSSCQDLTGSPTLCFSTTYNSRHLQEGFTRTTSCALSIPTTVYSASSGSSGTLCRTSAGSIASTTSGSASAIAITSTAAVRTTWTQTGLTSGHNYEMTITTTRYTPGTSTVIDTTTTVVSFTASGTSEAIDHDVEVNASYDCEDTSAVTVEV